MEGARPEAEAAAAYYREKGRGLHRQVVSLYCKMKRYNSDSDRDERAALDGVEPEEVLQQCFDNVEALTGLEVIATGGSLPKHPVRASDGSADVSA